MLKSYFRQSLLFIWIYISLDSASVMPSGAWLYNCFCTVQNNVTWCNGFLMTGICNRIGPTVCNEGTRFDNHVDGDASVDLYHVSACHWYPNCCQISPQLRHRIDATIVRIWRIHHQQLYDHDTLSVVVYVQLLATLPAFLCAAFFVITPTLAGCLDSCGWRLT